MLHHKLILACLISILHGNRNLICPVNNELVQDIAATATYYAERNNISADVVVAVADYESKFKKYSRSQKGAIGIYQVLRHGAVQGMDLKRSFNELADLDTNTRIATEYMSKMAQKCHNIATLWLSAYNGNGCVPSRYSRIILLNLSHARRQAELKWPLMTWGTRSLHLSPIDHTNSDHFDTLYMDNMSEGHNRTSYNRVDIAPTKTFHTHAGKRQAKLLVRVEEPIVIVAH